MPDFSIAGYQCYLIIERQTAGQCPSHFWTYLDGNTDDPIVQNGVIFVSTSFAAPYTSFTAVVQAAFADPAPGNLVAWIFDLETGEGRYYDGTQGNDATIYWTPMKRAIGRVHSFKPTIKRDVTPLSELGTQRPVALKDGRYEYGFTIDKAWIDVWKVGKATIPNPERGPDIDKPAQNQYGFRGEALVNVDEWVRILQQNYHLVILYAVELTGTSTTAPTARVWLAPCAMFDEVSINPTARGMINASLAGTCTFMRDIIADETDFQGNDQIQTYAYSSPSTPLPVPP